MITVQVKNRSTVCSDAEVTVPTAGRAGWADLEPEN